MTRKQDKRKGRITAEELRKMLAEDRDSLKVIVEETLQSVQTVSKKLEAL